MQNHIYTPEKKQEIVKCENSDEKHLKLSCVPCGIGEKDYFQKYLKKCKKVLMKVIFFFFLEER